MSEFKIKVNVELDAKDLESQLKNLGEQEINVKLNGVDKIEAQLKSLKNSFQDAFKVNGSFLNDLKKVANAMDKVNGGGSTSKPTSSASKLVSEYKDLANTIEKIQKQLNKGLLNDDSIARSNSLIEKLKGQMKDLEGVMDEVELASVKAFEGKLENKHFAEMNNYLNKIESTATSLGTKLKSISFDHIDSSKIEKIQNELKEILDIAKQDIDLELNVSDILSKLNNIASEIKNLEKIENLASVFDKISSSVIDSKDDVEKLKSTILDLVNVSDKLDGTFDKTFKGASNSVKDFQNSLEKVKTSSSMFGNWDDFTGNFSQFKIMDLAGDFIADGVRQMATAWKDTIVETDSAITDLNKVLNEGGKLTGQSLDNYLGQVTQVAKGTGKSSVDVIQGTARAVQSGIKSTEDALKYAEKSAMFANIGDMTQEQADKILTSVMSANGGIENSLKQTSSHLGKATEGYSKLEEFIDMANHAGNNFAVTTADVGTAMMLSTNALSANGVAMEEQIAMAVAMNEVLQDSSKTGNSLKSISANMSGVIFGLKQGDVQANKTAKALESLTGIKLFDEQTGEVMDMYEAMEQLNGKWDGLTEAQKSSIAQTIAGKQNLQSFLALMDNWDTARQYVDDYNKSVGKGNEIVGSASRENEQYLDSIQGKWNSIKENLKSIGTNLISSDMVKGVLDGIGKITEALANFTSTGFGSLVTSITGIVGGFKLLSGVLKTFKGFDFLKDIFGSGSIAKDFSTIGTTLKKTTSTVKSFGASLVGLATAHPVLTALIGTAVAVGGAWYYVETANERAIKKSQEAQAEMKKEIDLEQKKIDSLGSIAEEYDDLYFKTNKTDEELARYKELVNEIASIYPELVTGYDASGDPILALKGNAEAYLSTLKEVQEERERVLNEEQNKEGDLQKKQLEETMKAYDELKKKQSELANSEQSAFSYNPALDKQMYEEAKRLYEEYQKEKIAINEQTLNDLQSKKFYEGLSDGYKKEIDEMFKDTFDFANLFKQQGQEGVDSFLNEAHKLEKGFMETSKLTDEQIEKNNKLSESYNKQKINLDSYTDSLRKNYEEQGKIDFDSFDQWYDSVQAYAEKTGDLKGANDQIREMVGFLSELTGLDPVDLVQLLGIDGLDVSPLTEAEKRLNSFLESYGTASSNLGKGGLADKIESEFKAIENAQKSLMKMDRSELTIPTLIKLTAESTGNVQDLVTEMINKGIDDEVMYDIMLNVTTDIANGGEISDATIAQISEILDMPEEEVRARFTVKADIQNQQEIDDLLKKYDDLDLETEAKIRTVVDNKEEAETLYNTLKKIDDEETRAKVIADFGNAKQEAMELGTTINGLPPEKKLEYHMVFDGADETIGNIENIVEKMNEADGKEVRAQLIAEMDDGQILMFNDVLSQVDGKTATAFLQADGAIEALAQCESVEEMLALIENYKATGEIGIEVEGEEGIQATKTSMEQINGMRAEGIVTVQTEEEGLKYMQGQLVELDGKTYMVTVNADTQEKELVEFSGKVEEINGKTATANVNASVSGKDDVTQLGKDVKNLPTDATVEVEAKVKQNSKGSIFDTIKSWFGGGSTQSVEVNVKGKVTDVEMPTNTNATINVQANVTGSEQINTLKNNISTLQNKTVTVSANVSGSDLVNTLKTNISGIQGKSVAVRATVSGTSEVNALKSSISSLKGKSVSVKASVTGTNLVQALTNAIKVVQGKTVNVTANVKGTSETKALTNAINAVKGKSVSVKASVSGTSEVRSLASAIASVNSKTVSVRVNKSITTTQKTVQANSTPRSNVSTISNTPSTVNTTNLSNIPISASDTPTGKTPSLANTTISASAVNRGAILSDVEYNIEPYMELEQALEKLSSMYDEIDEKAKRAFGSEKLTLLDQQLQIMEQQKQAQKLIAEEEQSQLDVLKSQLQAKGFIVSANNNILNYEAQLLAMEKQVDSLRQKSDASKDDESLKNQYEKANEQLELTKKYLDEFIDSNKQLSDTNVEWQKLENSIAETKKEMNEVFNQNVRNRIEWYSDAVDVLSAKLDSLYGSDKIKGINEQNGYLKLQQEEIKRLIAQLENQRSSVNSVSDEYADLSSEIADLNAEWWKIEETIKDNQMEIFEEQTRSTRNEMDKLSDTIDFLDSKIENLYGTEKINYINQQSNAYREQQQVLHILAEQLRVQRSQLDPLSEEYADLSSEISDLNTEWWELQKALKENQMEVFEEQVRGIKNHINELSDSIDFLDEKIENMNGTAKIGYIEEQNALYKQQQEALHILAEQMRVQLALLDPLSDEYADLSSEIKGLSTEWWELENAIKDNMFEIFEEQTEGVKNKIDDITNSIDFLDAKMDNYSGEEKIAMLEEQNSLYKTQQNALHELTELLRSQLATLDPMSDEYQDMKNEISGLSTEWWELEKAISGNLDAIEEIHEEHREALRDQLDTTKDIEEKITKVYEKEYEERKKELEDYYDKRTKLLNEEKEAYREMRDTQEYEKGLQDQTDEIDELRKKLEIAKRDTSLQGLKRQKEIAEELADAEENLAKYTQDKIDEDYEKNIDNEIEKVEQEKNVLLKELEEQFSEVNIAKMVQSALTSGFIEVNGEIKSIQEILIESINNSANAYSVLGATVKQELVDNLNIALDTMKELEGIYKDLNVSDYGIITSNISSSIPNNYSTNTKNITIGDTNITISGTVSDNMLDDIEELIEQKNREMLKSISKDL